MARCFFTSVEFRVEDGQVLNRADAYRLLRLLRNRYESLERLITQLSPLDTSVETATHFPKHSGGARHRMLCKAVAEALAPAYPEIELFIAWPALLARNVRERMRLLKDHPLYGVAIAGLSDDDLVTVANLGRQVLRSIDPRRELPHAASLAIKIGICARHRMQSAAHISRLIRCAVIQNDDLAQLGVPDEVLTMLREGLARIISPAALQPAQP